MNIYIYMTIIIYLICVYIYNWRLTLPLAPPSLTHGHVTGFAHVLGDVTPRYGRSVRVPAIVMAAQ